MINFLCLKWGDKYSVDYVNILYNMVQRHYSKEFNFYCMTDNSEGINPCINIVPLLEQDYVGWWHKICFFHPLLEEFIQGRVITLDLDLVIVDNIDCLDTTNKFSILADYFPANGFNSSIMNFTVGTMNTIFTSFHKKYAEQLWGDQAWITQVSKEIAVVYPKEWVRSYKFEILSPEFHIPKDCKIILYHGKPDPHETLQHVGKYWC